ncbi:short chain dehydrogenase domain-containing protein [Trichoderma breve]|uniref:Short chain dehydrogenase domain-containing protein n=1 Tax=Trichoderma breve TaxID=2034170 RepID=A0A9W9B2E1_9HYPO|nr:short chain dehydrogenase domain-containing protein [Trichoderma breve]KAJ4854395.1 short chain dehydrogenase domain-containing protein [Trichoderma breve]
MTASKKTVVLITGANRGIGFQLARKFLSRDNTILIAAVRNPDNASSTKALLELPHGTESSLIITKIDSLDTSSATSGLASISDRIDHLDLVIANAGILDAYGPVMEMSLDDVSAHVAVNTLGPIALLQAAKSLLQNAANPRFVVISSSIGAYGASKAAINYLMRRVHFEEKWLTSMVICPGWTQTDMGNTGAQKLNFGETAPVPLDVSVDGVFQEIDEMKRTEGGKFAAFDHIDRKW